MKLRPTTPVLDLMPKATVVSPVKLDPPEQKQVSFDYMIETFGTQAEDAPIDSQRNHPARAAAGKAKHISADPSKVQTTSAQFDVYRVCINGELDPTLWLADGYHRLSKWIAEGTCPFTALNLTIHTINVDAEDEVEYAVDLLFRSINSKQSVKTNSDFFCAALRSAFRSEGLVPKSKGYTLGVNALSVFRRAMGPADKTPLPKLQAAAQAHLAAHVALDEFYCFIETKLKRKSVVYPGKTMARVYFTPGVAYALFNFFKSGDGTLALEMLKPVFDKLESPVSYPKDVLALRNRLAAFANPEYVRSVTATAKNVEQGYDRIADNLRPVLQKALGSLVAPKKVKKAV